MQPSSGRSPALQPGHARFSEWNNHVAAAVRGVRLPWSWRELWRRKIERDWLADSTAPTANETKGPATPGGSWLCTVPHGLGSSAPVSLRGRGVGSTRMAGRSLLPRIVGDARWRVVRRSRPVPRRNRAQVRLRQRGCGCGREGRGGGCGGRDGDGVERTHQRLSQRRQPTARGQYGDTLRHCTARSANEDKR